ncbi:MAG: hypothetical protein KJ851_06280 [Nanoarchaeota archaeon]|nr:hypothetical protein [Nanoarchaeota archaeon]
MLAHPITNMYSELLVAAGAIFLIYSLYLSKEVARLIEWRYLKKPWRVLRILMLFALAGYLIRLRVIIISGMPDLLLDSILFFWAVFAMIAIRAIYYIVDWLKGSEREVYIGRHFIESGQNTIDKLRNEFELKNEELDKILVDLYALQNLLEKGGLKRSVTEKKRLNKILNELNLEVDAYKLTHINGRKTNV